METTRRTITMSLDDESVKRLDKLCKITDMNRSQLVRALVSGNDQKLALVFDSAKKIHTLF